MLMMVWTFLKTLWLTSPRICRDFHCRNSRLHGHCKAHSPGHQFGMKSLPRPMSHVKLSHKIPDFLFKTLNMKIWVFYNLKILKLKSVNKYRLKNPPLKKLKNVIVILQTYPATSFSCCRAELWLTWQEISKTCRKSNRNPLSTWHFNSSLHVVYNINHVVLYVTTNAHVSPYIYAFPS